MDTAIIQQRLPVLLKYLNSDTERQLQALYALQALIVSLDQPPSKLRILPPPVNDSGTFLLYRTGLSRVQTSLKARLEAEVEAGIEPLVLVVSIGNKD